ncbi:MAG: ComF family protein [Prevotellaceae bacterium]|jgi:ComF family protein|nr:ComF family protein [Prevotellaceae bacterium]
MKVVRDIFLDFVNLIYPSCCEACGMLLVAGEHVLCSSCRYKLPRTNYWLQKGNPVEQIFWGRVPVANACSLFFMGKGSSYRKLLHSLKYRNKPQIGVALGQLLGNELAKVADYADVEFIMPIPLHVKRQRKRGYNQSEKIAIGISQAIGKPLLTDAVFRQQYNETQTKKTREERWSNVSEVFAVRPNAAARLAGKHILLVDDVLTTGATIEACIATILKAADCKISVATLAVAK